MRFIPFLLLLLACKGRDDDPEPVDLAVRLDAGQTRVGVITSDDALFGGISAEGQPGDFKLYNDRVQFIVQGPRIGAYMSSYGGGVIDADIVRPEGQVGHDIVNEWGPMLGLAKYMDGTTMTVVSDGSDGVAHLRVEGTDAPLQYIAAAFELPQTDLGLEITTDYILRPDTYLLEVSTTLLATEPVTGIQPGDGIQGAKEVAEMFESGGGYSRLQAGEQRDWIGWMSEEVTVATLRGDHPVSAASGAAVLGLLMELAGSFEEPVDLQAGEQHVYTRFYGVGPDAASLTDDRMAAEPTDTVSGVVTAADGPVEGARVVISVGDLPWTVARTAADGSFEASVLRGATPTFLADGRGNGRVMDLPEGSGRYGPYAADALRAASLGSLSGEALGATARGRGVGSQVDPLVLAQPALLDIRVDDGQPFEVKLRAVEADAAADPRVRPRPEGAIAYGWSADGAMQLPVEPGEYEIIVHRGIRFEAHSEVRQLAAGETVALDVDLIAAYDHTGWLLSDPHQHASPSPDGVVSMEERLLSSAGVGLQLHFGTDHDHIADYRPLIGPLGIGDSLNSVVANEVSPFIRGHVNIYPVEPIANQPNGGAWMWYWEPPVASTEAQMAGLRERHGDGYRLQINHPFVLGMVGAADWEPGLIADPDYWSDDFQTMEVLNAADSGEYLPFFFDMVNRGKGVAPMGTSDSHNHMNIGHTATFLPVGTTPTDYTDDALRAAIDAQRTLVTRGVFLDMNLEPGSTVPGGSTLEVAARSASWVVVDELQLYKDGELIATVPGTSMSVQLDTGSDASYTVMAQGSTPMEPVWPEVTPWAMSSPILVDVAGDGWDPPLPPLQLGASR